MPYTKGGLQGMGRIEEIRLGLGGSPCLEYWVWGRQERVLLVSANRRPGKEERKPLLAS